MIFTGEDMELSILLLLSTITLLLLLCTTITIRSVVGA